MGDVDAASLSCTGEVDIRDSLSTVIVVGTGIGCEELEGSRGELAISAAASLSLSSVPLRFLGVVEGVLFSFSFAEDVDLPPLLPASYST